MRRILLALMALLLSSALFAAPLKEIVVFGDSLSDDGNLYNLLKIIPKTPPYYQGRFSNGPTWAEYVGNHFYGTQYSGYKIYAYAGATSYLHNLSNDPFIAPSTLTAQIYTYLSGHVFTNFSNKLYVVWIGGNDYLFDQNQDTNALTTDTVNNILWAMDTLRIQGAKNFLVLNLPDLAAAPIAKTFHNADRLHALTLEHNQKLNAAVNDFKNKHGNVNIVYINVYDIFQQIMNSPAQFNQQYGQHFSNFSDACWQGGVMFKNGLSNKSIQSELALTHKQDANFSAENAANSIIHTPELAQAYQVGKLFDSGVKPCDDANAYIFWDDIHPTAAVHQVLGNIVIKTLEDSHIMTS